MKCLRLDSICTECVDIDPCMPRPGLAEGPTELVRIAADSVLPPSNPVEARVESRCASSINGSHTPTGKPSSFREVSAERPTDGMEREGDESRPSESSQRSKRSVSDARAMPSTISAGTNVSFAMVDAMTGDSKGADGLCDVAVSYGDVGVASYPVANSSQASASLGALSLPTVIAGGINIDEDEVEEGTIAVGRGRSLSEESIMEGVQRRIRYSENITEINAAEAMGGISQSNAALPGTLWPPPKSIQKDHAESSKETAGYRAERLCCDSNDMSLVMVMVTLVVAQSITISVCLFFAMETFIIAAANENLPTVLQRARVACSLLCALLTGIGMAVSGIVGRWVTQQFERIRHQLRQMEESTIAAVNGDDGMGPQASLTSSNSRSATAPAHMKMARISCVRKLQVDVIQLSRNLKVLPRFLPATVVRAIVRGDDTALRLHVKSKEVTIMFSDVADFTRITEALHPNDMMFLLTRYLSVMSHIVEMFGGVVAEIFGDGLLAYWNTPDETEDHAAKAVASALAQQKALMPLNEEMTRARLEVQQLSTRIGISTGRVYTGNIGSENKMKWGCMGDSVNLAARLEGLNKVYGTNIVCEGTTRDAIRHHKFFLRRLDRVQVKGKTLPTEVYEVIGLVDTGEDSESGESGYAVIKAADSNNNLTRAVKEAFKASNTSMDKSRAFLKLPDSFRRRFSGSWSPPPAIRPGSGMDTPARTISHNSSVTATKRVSFDISSNTKSEAKLESNRSFHSLNNCLSDGVTDQAQDQVVQYERALEAFQSGKFVQSKEICERLRLELPNDLALKVLFERTSRHVAPDGKSIVGLTEAELAQWTGIHVMDHK